MKSMLTWLGETTTVLREQPNGPPIREEVKIVERLAELIAVNFGKTEVHQWGQPKPAPGHPYGRVGLTMHEAIDLISLNGIHTGFVLCQDDDLVFAASRKMIQEEIMRVKKEGFKPATGEQKLVLAYSESDMKEITRLEKEIGKTLKT